MPCRWKHGHLWLSLYLCNRRCALTFFNVSPSGKTGLRLCSTKKKKTSLWGKSTAGSEICFVSVYLLLFEDCTYKWTLTTCPLLDMIVHLRVLTKVGTTALNVFFAPALLLAQKRASAAFSFLITLLNSTRLIDYQKVISLHPRNAEVSLCWTVKFSSSVILIQPISHCHKLQILCFLLCLLNMWCW